MPAMILVSNEDMSNAVTVIVYEENSRKWGLKLGKHARYIFGIETATCTAITGRYCTCFSGGVAEAVKRCAEAFTDGKESKHNGVLVIGFGASYIFMRKYWFW